MIPNIYIHEKLMFERAREWEREIEHQHLLSSLPKPHHSVMQWVIATLNAFLVVPSMRMPYVTLGGRDARFSEFLSRESRSNLPLHI